MAKSVSDYQIADDAKNLLLLLNRVLETTVDVFESAGVPIPEKRYWTAGEAVFDCEQVVVSLNQGYLGRPGDEATEPRLCHEPRSAVLDISVVRCVPTGNGTKGPSSRQLQDAAEFTAVDSWLLLDSINQYDEWHPGIRGLGVVATVTIPPPQGGFQAVNMTLTLAVP